MDIAIYALEHPETHERRYIGQSMDPERRLRNHVNYANCPELPVSYWVRKLVRQGIEPLMSIVMWVPEELADSAEVAMITYHSQVGCRLLNMTEGGKGARGYKWTEEQRERLRLIIQKRWENPEYVAAHHERMKHRDKSYLESQEFRQMVSRRRKEEWADPENRSRYIKAFRNRKIDREAMSQRALAMWKNNPHLREVYAERNRTLWQDPDFRKRHAEATTAGMTPDVCAHVSKKAKERMSDPAEREHLSEMAKAQWQDPEFLEKREVLNQEHSELIRGLWQDPEYQAKMKARDAKRSKNGTVRAAKILGMSRRQVSDLCMAGEIPAQRVSGRWVITDEDIEAFLARRSE